MIKMKTLIYGGAFDPPHFGHIHTLLEVIENGIQFDDIWIMPYAVDAFGIKELSSNEHRLNMLKILLDSFKGITEKFFIRTSRFDLNAGGFKSTYAMMLKLYEIYDMTEFSLIVGSDQAEQIETWSNYKELLKLTPLIVVPRGAPRYEKLVWALDENKKHIVLPQHDVLWKNISSTHIRQHISSGADLKEIYNYTATLVLSYIEKNKLYRNRSLYATNKQ